LLYFSFSPPWVNSVTAAFPSKFIVDGENLPSSFSEMLKDVAHYRDTFTFTPIG
jgi:hypothetical protein